MPLFSYMEGVEKVARKQLEYRQFKTTELKQMNAYLSTLAKRANQRLRELEKMDSPRSSKAYARTTTDAINLQKNKYDVMGREIFNPYTSTNKGAVKFRTNVASLKYQEAQQLQSTLLEFLNARTSTVKGTKEYYQDIADSLNTKFKTNYTATEWGDFWNLIKSNGVVISSELGVEVYQRLKSTEVSKEDIYEYIKSISGVRESIINHQINALNKSMSRDEKQAILKVGKWRSTEEKKKREKSKSKKKDRKQTRQTRRSKRKKR